MRILLLASLVSSVTAFISWSSSLSVPTQLYSTSAAVEPKDAVRLFGRLAEKYIMLDESGGTCCYSGCTDCEFRLPGGGYRMAEQSASRPKWIPTYALRTMKDKEHAAHWKAALFGDDDDSIDQATFVERLSEMAYAPPLGGPYVAASAAAIDDTTAAEALFQRLSDGKDKLTPIRMSRSLSQLSDGAQGITWAQFVEGF